MTAQQLKNAILQEAIQGRLVPQDPNDEPASVLLDRIRKEKARLVKEGKLKKKDLEEKLISEDEIPFEIPESWEWVRVAQIIYPPKYGTSNKSLISGLVPVLRMGNIQDGEIVFENLVYSNNEDDNKKYNLEKGDLLFNRTNSAELVGKTGIYRGQQKAIFAGYIILLRPISIDSEYLNFVLSSNYARSYCKEVKTIGVQQCNINAEKISSFIIPLPPLAEQRRIVAKIEELMPKVEEYGKAQEKLNKLNEELPERLKKSILQEAIEGRLVPQDPNDEPASALLAKIREEKKQLVKEGKLKKKDLEEKPISEDEIPFDIPESWEWCKLETITIPVGNKTNQIQSKEILNEGKVPVVSQGQKLIDGYSNEIEKAINELPLVMFGDHTRNVKLVDFPFVIGADGTKFFKPIKCDVKYIYYIVLHIASQLRNRGYARHYTLLRDEVFPLPPLAEQHRIVERIEQLFKEIDKLKK
jgi:type I restriction enzyme S subunit